MTASVLVTGGGGFIGSHLVKSQLERGHRVRAVDLHTKRLANLEAQSRLEIIKGDIADVSLLPRLVDGVDIVYHLASAHLDVTMEEDYYQKVNVDATVNLIRQAGKAGIKRFIHCSSNGVYGKLQNLPADENTPCHPTNIYEKTKLAGEKAALITAREVDLPLVVVRPSWVYGPGCPRTEKLFRTVWKGRFVFFGDGSTLRHPIYISDAVRGMELCATANQGTGEVYLLAGEKAVSLNELVQEIAKVLETKLSPVHLPVPLGDLAAYILEMVFIPLRKQPPFSRRSLDFFLKDNAYDTRKAQRDLAFQPEVNLHAGLVKTMQWWRDRTEEIQVAERTDARNG